MKRWPRVTSTRWAMEIDSHCLQWTALQSFSLPLSVASQGNHLMAACSQQHPEQVGTGHKNKWGGEKSTYRPQMTCSFCGKFGWVWVIDVSISDSFHWELIYQNMQVCVPPWSCLTIHLRFMCRFIKLATKLKLLPVKNKNKQKSSYLWNRAERHQSLDCTKFHFGF